MCPKPNIPKPIQRQEAQMPVFRDGADDGATRGRRGTILTGGTGIEDTQYGGKKTLLGQ